MAKEAIDSNFSNIRFETTGHNLKVWSLSFPLVKAIFRASGSTIEGTFSQEGAAFIVSNHISFEDPFWLYFIAAAVAKRSIRCWASENLLNPNVKESDFAKARRTSRDIMRGGQGEKLGYLFNRLIAGPYMRSFDPIPARIGGMNTDSLRQTWHEFDNDHIVAMFIEGTRRPEGDLTNFLPGVAMVMEGRPEVAIYPVGISGTDRGFPLSPSKRRTFRIGHPFSYKDILEAMPEIGDMRKKDRLIFASWFIIDRIGPLIADSKVCSTWHISMRLRKKLRYTIEQIEEAKKQDKTLSAFTDLLIRD